MRYYISFETGGTNLRFAVLDEALNVVSFRKTSTKEFNQHEDKFERLCELLAEEIRRVGESNILAISCSWAAMLSLDCKSIVSATNIRGFENFPMVERLQDRFSVPVVMMRDTNALLLYELERLPGDHSGMIVAIYLGTGLGNAICIDGKIYNGANGACGELGHIPIRMLEDTCICGKKGCIEILAGGRHLNELARDKYQVPVTEIFMRFGEEEDVRGVVTYSAMAIATEITILDPRYVILGGGVIGLPGFPKQMFEDCILRNLREPNPRFTTRLVYATGDDEAGVIGAAMNAKKELKL